MSNTKSKISDNTVRHPHSSRHRQLSRRRNLNRLRSLNRQRRLSHLRRWRHLRTLYHNIGSWLPRYKNYTQKNGLFPVPFWVKPHHVPFRSEERPNHITLRKYIYAWRKYYDYLRNVKSASINTTRNYMSDIVTFHEYLSHKYRIHKESLEKLSNYKIWLSEKNTESDEDPLNIDLACAHLEWCNSIKYGKKSEINPSKWEIKPYEGWQEYEQLVQWLGQPNTYPPNISPSWEKEIRKAIPREETESQLQEKNGQLRSLYKAWEKESRRNSGNEISAETDIEYEFGQYLKESGLAFEKLDHPRLRQYQRWLLDESNGKRARTTVSLKTSALRSSYEYLKSIKTISNENNPVAKGFLLGDRSLPKPLSRTETDRLLNIPETDSRFPKRDLAILEVLYSCGIRLSEIHGITLGDINFKEKQIHIRHGKGNDKQRDVLFGNPASIVLNDYLKEERPALINKRVVAKSDNVNSPVFLNQYGGQLGQRSIQKIVRKYSDRAGLTNRAHPHTLRHSFATHMLQEDESTKEADLRVIQELMGHETPVTTGRYTKLTKNETRRAYLTYHPRANITT